MELFVWFPIGFIALYFEVFFFFVLYDFIFFYIPLTNLGSTVSFILKCTFNVQQLKINFKHISPLKYHNIFLLSDLYIYYFLLHVKISS